MDSHTNGLRVGFVGLGVMGGPMARHVVDAGFPVTAWARRPETLAPLVERGLTPASSPAVLAAACDIVVDVLPDLPQLTELLEGEDGLLAGLDHPVTLVISSTSSPTKVRDLARELAERTNGLLTVVDAPISGGETGAVEGTLSVMVGGEAEDVARVEPVLAAFGVPVHLGPLGSGQVAKACNQMIVAANVTALSEAAVLAERSGLDLRKLFDCLLQGYASSRVMEVKKDRFVTHDHSPSGPARFMVKDLGFALDQAGDVATTIPLTTTLRELFADLTDRGFGDNDTAVVQAYIEGLSAPRAGGRHAAPTE